ncbi:hypothetical protein M9H77_09411 [Catharanthus roseus]|uniref:Uncharacterized protein n=1 Tax=Catharanthus roseus TaxID=4058 RepID=A0ACC0C0X7_CATRO|nr:hypothetical protein M9H77_09411 [Catharanthus roseus]
MYRERRPEVKGLTSQFINEVDYFIRQLQWLEDRRDTTPSLAPPIIQGPHTTSQLSTSQLSAPAAPEMDPLASDMGPPAWRPPLGDSREAATESQLSFRSSSTGLTTLDKDGIRVKGERPIKGFDGRLPGKKQEAAVD